MYSKKCFLYVLHSFAYLFSGGLFLTLFSCVLNKYVCTQNYIPTSFVLQVMLVQIIDDILQVLENRHTMMRYAKQCIYLIYLQNLQSLDSQDLAGRRSISPIRSPIAAAAAVKGPADHLPLAVSPNFNFKDVDTTYVGASAIGKDINV